MKVWQELVELCVRGHRSTGLPFEERRWACDVAKIIVSKVVCLKGREKYRDEAKRKWKGKPIKKFNNYKSCFNFAYSIHCFSDI